MHDGTGGLKSFLGMTKGSPLVLYGETMSFVGTTGIGFTYAHTATTPR